MVQIVMLKSVESDSSTSLTVDYYFVDPFGTLGMVYLELHSLDELKEKGFTNVSQLYNAEDDMNYWENFGGNDSAGKRVSVSTYESSYTFNGLTPETQYYVVIGHQAEDAETYEIERYLDDYTKVQTIAGQNSLKINSVTSGGVSVTLRLESVSVCSGGTIELLNDEDTAIDRVELNSDDISAAASAGYQASFSATMSDLSGIVVVFLDESGNVILTARGANNFYVQGEDANVNTALLLPAPSIGDNITDEQTEQPESEPESEE